MACDVMQFGNGKACLCCTTSDVVFGPIMASVDVAEAFRSHCYRELRIDPRQLNDSKLESAYNTFVTENVCQCGELRETECWMCKSSSFDEAIDGFHQEHDGDREPCEIQPVRTDGRFQCDDCKDKAEKKAARKAAAA